MVRQQCEEICKRKNAFFKSKEVMLSKWKRAGAIFVHVFNYYSFRQKFEQGIHAIKENYILRRVKFKKAREVLHARREEELRQAEKNMNSSAFTKFRLSWNDQVLPLVDFEAQHFSGQTF